MKQKICAAVLSAAMLICAYGTAVFASTDNIALNAQCTTNSQNGQHVAGRAVDGNLSTRWQAIWKETAPWIIIDLGEEKTFNKISLTTTVPQYLTSYKVEAADDADFTVNAVNVTDGAGSAAQTVYKNLFSAVNKRYVKVSFVTPNGLAISKIELYNTDIVSIAVDDEYQGVAVPEESGAANHADAPAVTLTDETGDSFAAPSGAVRWSLNESYDGVSIDGLTGEITVTNTASAGTVSVRAELASDTAKYVDKTLEISKEDGTNVNFAHAFELTVTNSYSPDTEANLNDESYDTVWESGNDTVSSFTFKTNGKPLNKLLAYFGSFDGVTGFCVSAADSADFSDAEVLASKDDFKERTAVSFRETSKEYIKLEIIHTKEISLKEIELYKMTPYVIEFAKGYGTVVIPAEGGESITVKHDAVVADKHGDAVDSSNCTVTYELQGYGAEGLSLNGEDGTITVENNAVDGIYSVQASMPDYSYIQPVMLPIDLKPDVLNGADSINFALGKEVRVTSEHGSHPKGNAVDGSVKTRWKPLLKTLTRQ